MNNSSKKINRKEIRWRVPQPNFSKLNFDGVSKGNSGRSGIDCIIKDHSGSLNVACWTIILDGSNNIVEAQALLFGVRLAVTNHILDLIIEGISMNIILSFNGFHAQNRKINYIIQEIRSLIQHIPNFQVMHCFREANQVVDFLANQGCGIQDGDTK
ncbi:hypothetical protein SUGI_0190990 [Cryptomeria japonica]|nr:hypothetical protein SUGI_0190990 [Cryptomeria japonica]